MTDQGLDLRLVPAALAAWAAAFVGVLGPASLSLAGAGAALVTACLLLLRDVPTPRSGAATAHVPGQAPRSGSVRTTVSLVLVVTAAVAVSTGAQLHARERGSLDDLVGERASVELVGQVRSEPVPVAGRWDQAPGARYRVVLAVSQVTGRGRTTAERTEVVALGGPAWADLAYGQTVHATGRLAPVDRGGRAAALLSAHAVEVALPAGRADRTVTGLREALLTVTDDLPPDARGLVPGAAIGDTRRVPADLDQAMRDTGLTHITAVSGGHFAVLVVTVLTLTSVLRLPPWVRALTCAAVMTGFVLVVHPAPSVVRAAAMGALVVGGLLVRRPSRPVAALGAAVVVLVVLDPWLARSYGFVLSVLATGAIVVLAPPLARALAHAVPRPAALVVAVPVAAQAACGPVLVLLDPVVATYAVPANILAAPALLPATLLGAATTVTASWAPGAATVLAHGAAAATWWIALVARTFAGLPGARLAWPAGAVGALLLAGVTALLVAALLVVPRLPRGRRRALLAAGLVIGLVLGPVGDGVRGVLPGSGPPRDWRVVACDVGQGDALLVRSGPDSAVMVDVGPDGSADRCLTEHGVRRIDLLVLTHPHADHVGGLDAVLAGRPVAQALVSPADPADGAVGSALARAGVPVATASNDPSAPVVMMDDAPDRTRAVLSSGASGAVTWQVVWPPPGSARASAEDSSAVNDASVVLLLEVDGLTVLALGDLEPTAQVPLLAHLRTLTDPRPLEVVKVAHHGSAHQSPELARWLAPSLALVSAGAGNDYGHPAPSTVLLYRDAGAAVLSTHECGRIAVGRVQEGLEVHARCSPSPG